ncbi:MAG: hypothetical protein RRX93_01805 [Bacteroidales bacterium]
MNHLKKSVYYSLVFLVFLCLSTRVFSQKIALRHHEFGIAGGWAFPMSDFKGLPLFDKTNNTMSINGAKTGLSMDVHYTYFPWKWAGFGLLVNAQMYDLNGDAKNALKASIPNLAFPGVALESSRWQNYSIRFVVDINIPLFLGLSITARGTAGAAWQITPPIDLYFGVPNPPYLGSLSYQSDVKANFITSGGIGIKWRIIGPLTLTANADYQYSPTYKHKDVLVALSPENINTPNESTGKININQPYQAVTFTFGLAFKF